MPLGNISAHSENQFGKVKQNSTRSDLCNWEIYWKRVHLSRDIFVKNERCKLLKAGCSVFICHSEATLRAYRSLDKPSGRQRCDKVAQSAPKTDIHSRFRNRGSRTLFKQGSVAKFFKIVIKSIKILHTIFIWILSSFHSF